VIEDHFLVEVAQVVESIGHMWVGPLPPTPSRKGRGS
jgi:hypothetical protein